MDKRRRELNEYLMVEFGLDETASAPSETWPFVLEELGEASGKVVFAFDDDERYFAMYGTALSFLPQAGMTLSDLSAQFRGAAWVTAEDPVDLATSLLGDASVPSTVERRSMLEAIGAAALPVGDPELLEGLFLRRSRSYVGLFVLADQPSAMVVGLPGERTVAVPFPKASPWGRLAWGAGQWLQETQAERELARGGPLRGPQVK